jgi:DNA-binding transcriptional MocR family regulator
MLLAPAQTPTALVERIHQDVAAATRRGDFHQRMLDLGYLLAPGALFHARRQPSTLMRINFATTQEAQFWQVFEAIRVELMGGMAAGRVSVAPVVN